MRVLVALCLIHLVLGACAQNIVRNGSFEVMTQCPDSPGSVYLAEPWYPGGGASSPDFMSTCGICEWCTAPGNVHGNQNPRTDSSYALFGAYYLPFEDAHELLMQPLKYTLVAGETYYFEMYVSLADSFNYACHNLGMTVTDTINESWSLDCFPDCQPFVENTALNPLDDKEGWTRISGTFVAGVDQKYIFIGNLRPDSESSVEYVGGGAPNGQYNWEGAAYYLDDVWLSHIDSAHYVGVEEEQLSMKNEQLTIWPNPANDVLNIEMNNRNSTGLHVEIKDLLGRSVLTTSANSSKFQIDISALNSGVYCVVVRDRAGGVLVQKVVKE